jgi:hypothetical protein
MKDEDREWDAIWMKQIDVIFDYVLNIWWEISLFVRAPQRILQMPENDHKDRESNYW